MSSSLVPLKNCGEERAAARSNMSWLKVLSLLHEGFWRRNHVILNHGQVTWMTPEMAPPSPNYHTTPKGGRFSSRQIERSLLPYTAGL
ncbi:hypothetical protein TNCV_1627481 [Trichonephila clavipes]|nr:hypothetical protein TNCV_1627481 [Trichonephila clavipes]